jgi:hypothetical protein
MCFGQLQKLPRVTDKGAVLGSGLFLGEAESNTSFEQVFEGCWGRYAGLNTLGAGSIPSGVGGARYLLPRSKKSSVNCHELLDTNRANRARWFRDKTCWR